MAAIRSVHATAPRGRVPRRVAAVAAVVAASLLAVIGPPTTAGAHTADRSKIVLFVHGYNPISTSTDCGGEFDRMIGQLRAEGFSGRMVKVGFYSGDRDCDVNLHSYGSYRDRSSWKAVAGAFSNYVHATYTSRGIAVDVVGYSMGGLIARGAVHGAEVGERGFSAPIDVEDVVTLGTPHTGAAWYSRLCLWGQCSQLKPGASDLRWLNRDGNPQGRNGTDWTNIASYGDWVTPAASAASMDIASSARVVYSSIPHIGSRNYMGSATATSRTGVGLAERLR
ncbi:MAG: hypothetical protein JWM47_3339 [Acidimicrobiales bacterium]|nr:hypothetical protein [Acidimicrobiales bacterium]